MSETQITDTTEPTTTRRSETYDIAPGIRLVVDARFEDDTDSISLVHSLIRRCKIIALGRDALAARVKECIEQLAKIDEERNGEDEGLVRVSEAMGWISNITTHTTADYRRALLALVDVIDDDDLASAYEECEYQLKHATGGAS